MNVRIVNSDCVIFNVIKEDMSISWLFIAANDCLNFWNQVNSEIIIKRGKRVFLNEIYKSNYLKHYFNRVPQRLQS